MAASALEYALLMDPNRRFHARFQLHFLEHMLDVDFDRAFGDVQTAGDHFVRQALGNQLENIALARGQLADVAVRGGAISAGWQTAPGLTLR